MTTIIHLTRATDQKAIEQVAMELSAGNEVVLTYTDAEYFNLAGGTDKTVKIGALAKVGNWLQVYTQIYNNPIGQILLKGIVKYMEDYQEAAQFAGNIQCALFSYEATKENIETAVSQLC